MFTRAKTQKIFGLLIKTMCCPYSRNDQWVYYLLHLRMMSAFLIRFNDTYEFRIPMVKGIHKPQ